MKNEVGTTLTLCNVGASIFSISLPIEGKDTVVTLSSLDKDSFLSSDQLLGKTLGRTAGRICHSIVYVNEQSYALEPLEGKHTVHGGRTNLAYQTFDYRVDYGIDECSVIFKYLSPFGEGGYPGQVTFMVRYTLKNHRHEVQTTYEATTNFPTVVNPSSLLAFDFHPSRGSSWKDHLLAIPAQQQIMLDEETCPLRVSPLPSSFCHTELMAIKEGLSFTQEQAYVITGSPVTLYSPHSHWGVHMTTSYPSVTLTPIHENLPIKQTKCAFMFLHPPFDFQHYRLMPHETFKNIIQYRFFKK